MAVTLRSAATMVNATTTGNSTVTEPSGAASGDILVALAVCDAGSSLTPPSGWTTPSGYSGTQGGFQYAMSYVARGGSAPNLTWGVSGSNKYREIHVFAFKSGNANAVTLDATATAGATGNAATHFPDPPSVTAVATTSISICGGVNWAGTSSTAWTPPTNYTLISDNTSGNDCCVATRALSAAGAENPGAFGGVLSTGAASDYWDGFTITLTDTVSGGLTAAQMQGIFDAQRTGSVVIGRVDA